MTYTGNTAVGLVREEALAPDSALNGGGSGHDGSQDSETDHFGGFEGGKVKCDLSCCEEECDDDVDESE